MYNYPTYSKTLFLQPLFVLIQFFFYNWYQEMDAINYSLWLSDLPSDNLYHIVMNIPPLPKGNASRFMVDSP